MQKRAALARAIALDPEVLFFDEPSAGLDPISSRLLDDLILSLRDSLGATVVMVSHELPSIFAIGDDCIFLDTAVRTMDAPLPGIGPWDEILKNPLLWHFNFRGPDMTSDTVPRVEVPPIRPVGLAPNARRTGPPDSAGSISRSVA